MIDTSDALYILGIDEPSQDLLDSISFLSDASDDNTWARNNGYPELVDDDYGPELNDLAQRLGIMHHSS